MFCCKFVLLGPFVDMYECMSGNRLYIFNLPHGLRQADRFKRTSSKSIVLLERCPLGVRESVDNLSVIYSETYD